MKIRSGFVSNSSSSSFIVGFPTMPKSAEELETIMFGESGGEVQPWDFSQATPTIDVAKRVFSDITNTNVKKHTKASLFKSLVKDHGNFPGAPNTWRRKGEADKFADEFTNETGKNVHEEGVDPKIFEFYQKLYKKDRQRENKDLKIAARGFIEGFWPRVKNMKVFELSYADDNGEANLEHGDIFRNLPHIRISHH